MTEREEERAEVAILGAALADPDLARTMAQELATFDFTQEARREVYRLVATRLVRGDPISAGVVLESLGPDRAAELGISEDLLETWALDSPASTDPARFGLLVDQVRRRRIRRDLVKSLREIAHEDLTPDLPQDRKDRATRALEKAGISLDALVSTNGHAELRSLDLVEAAHGPTIDVPYVLDGWLAKGDLAILAGESGAGKSLLLLDLALALALGRPWLGRIAQPPELPPQRILIVDEEQPQSLVRYRLKRWMVAKGLEPEALEGIGVRYLVDNGVNLDDDVAFQRLKREVEDLAPDWIFLDSLIRFHRRKENDNAGMAEWYAQRLKPLQRMTGAGVVVLHHLGKFSKEKGTSLSSRLRGASDIKAQCDQLYGLEEDPESAQKILVHAKNRWAAEAAPIKVEIEDVKEGRGLDVYSPGKAFDAGGTIETALREAGSEGITRQALIKAVRDEGLGFPDRAVSDHLRKLTKSGDIRKRREGRGKRIFLHFFAPIDAED